jgi:site-specific recombinase XerD
MKGNELTQFVQTFFQSHLPVERNLSTHTIKAYRDTIKLYLKYLASSKKRKIQQLTLEDMNAKSVMSFVEDCGVNRGNAVKTTNQRLAVLKSFFTYLLNVDPTRANQYERIFHMKSRRVPYKPVEYLFREEIEAIKSAIDRTTAKGKRDHAMILFLYNTGARAQELCDIKVGDLRFEKPYLAVLHGKGNKTRQVPLWKETVEAIQEIILDGVVDERRHLFVNRRGEKITRFGLRYLIQHYVKKAIVKLPMLKRKKVGPHTFRHTTAMHLLQAGVDITIIKSWLGHVDLNTTHGYVEIDLKMKEQALRKTEPGQKNQRPHKFVKKEKDLIEWLESFGDM